MNSGIIVLDKKMGFTSMASDNFIKKLIGTRKVGHHGTLDPFATGVLPIYVGDALKVVRYADDYDKKYECIVRFGVRTDSQDREGEAIGGRYPTDEELGQIVSDDFRIIRDAFAKTSELKEQTPPVYSAKKINGKKAYELAREGVEVKLDAHPIDIYELDVLDVYVTSEDNLPSTIEAKIRVHCSKGTYIRSLCDYAGELTGFGAHAKELRRIACGPFDISMSYTEEQLKEMVLKEDYSFFLPRNTGVSHLPKLILNAKQAADVKLGRKISSKGFDVKFGGDQILYAAYFEEKLVAVLYPAIENGHKLLRIERMLASND